MDAYEVEVSGRWLDAFTKTGQDKRETFRVVAPAAASAEVAGTQLFGAAAAAERCVVGDCTARAAP